MGAGGGWDPLSDITYLFIIIMYNIIINYTNILLIHLILKENPHM